MKFGEKLKANKDPAFAAHYLDYEGLKRIIRALADNETTSLDVIPSKISLSVAQGGRKKKQLHNDDISDEEMEEKTLLDKSGKSISEETFYSTIERNIHSVDSFTKLKVKEIREQLNKLRSEIGLSSHSIHEVNFTPQFDNEAQQENFINRLEEVGELFLRVEKYVNLNFTGFSKILKKHDRWIPNNQCKPFYMNRLMNQDWTQGRYTDIIVTMSQIYSCIRQDIVPDVVKKEKQDFVRSTTKYWVQEDDISRVKCFILQNLPVFIQESEDGSNDAQLINSIYLDNTSLELYRGRLNKLPGAIAIRFRWYGSRTPKTVFVERKTHQDSWTGNISVKERFIVSAEEIESILEGTFDKNPHIRRMEENGKSNEEIEDWDKLVSEVLQAINSKQLVPTLRTQYMRTAFQIPMDATVRVSIDTSLNMNLETARIGEPGWFRNPKKAIPRTEITKFPHAVLEVKLQLQDMDAKPHWVTELEESGALQRVDKFSKFIHGCAVLLKDDVPEYPYWIDDPTLLQSMILSGATDVSSAPLPKDGKSEENKMIGIHSYYPQLLPNAPKKDLTIKEKRGNTLPSYQTAPSDWQANHSITISDTPGCCDRLFYCAWARNPPSEGHFALQKIEPKIFFANERTYIHWLNMSVTLSSVASLILAFSADGHITETYGLILLPICAIFACYALRILFWRANLIKTRENTRWDNPWGPILMSATLTMALSTLFALELYSFFKEHQLDL